MRYLSISRIIHKSRMQYYRAFLESEATNDIDADGVCGDVDNCPDDVNADQTDSDGDLGGDVCDVCPLDALNDAEADGHCADADNCPTVANADQANNDGDASGNACDVCPNDSLDDADADSFCADVDNCPVDANSDQLDFDGDDAGDACDADDDNDGVDDGGDLCQTSAPDSSVPVPSRSLKPNHYVWESGTTFTRGLSSGRRRHLRVAS